MTRMTYGNMMSMFLGEDVPVRRITEKLGNTNPKDPNKDKPTSDTAKAAAAKGLVWMGGPYYGPKDSDEATHTHKNGQFKPMTPKEKAEKKKREAPLNKSTGRASDAPNKIKVPPHSAAAQQFKDPTIDAETFIQGLDKQSAELVSKAKAIGVPEMDDTIIRLYKRLTNIARMRPSVKRSEEFQDLVDGYQIGLGPNKLYAETLGARGQLRKMFGNSFGQQALFFIKLAEESGVSLINLTTGKAQVKNSFSAAAKPDFGKGWTAGDLTVRKVFDSDDALQSLQNRYQRLYGPAGDDGELMQSGGKNAFAYFQHSVSANNSIEKLIDAAKHQLSDPDAEPRDYPAIIAALTEHRVRMQSMVKKFETMPPKARAHEIGSIYAKLAEQLYDADQDITISTMVSLSEVSLYDTEIAEGKEVYLPVDPTFPVGDKIIVTRKGTKIEKIEKISVKSNKNAAQSYGMPSSCSTIQRFHSDARMRNLISQRAGVAGYETGVSGEIIHDRGKFEQFAKLSGFDTVYTPEQLEQMRVIGQKITERTKTFKKQFKKDALDVDGDLKIKHMTELEFDPELIDLTKKLQKVVVGGDKAALVDLVGEYNANLMLGISTKRKEQKPPHYSMMIYSMMTFGTQLATSNGFDKVLHNHQAYIDGKYMSETTAGTANLRDWQMQWRPYDKRAGLMNAGFNILYDEPSKKHPRRK